MATDTGSPPATTMRTPFDDAVFAAYAKIHGVTRGMARARVRKVGWDGNPKGPRRDLPDGFPRFVFTPSGHGVGAVLVIYLHHRDDEPLVRYGRSPVGTWVHVDAGMLPATVGTALAGRRVDEVVDIPGLEGRRIVEVTDEDGTVTMRLQPLARHRHHETRKDAA